MSLELRARAALARLELFGFNPHQRRGPDGKFIKMADHELKRPRRPRGGRAPAKPENPLYRARREEYNVDVMQHVASNKIIMQDEDRYPELYALHAQAEAMAEGPERDAVIDQLVEQLNMHKTVDSPYRPPTTGGPQHAQATGGGQRPSIDAPYDERREALRASVDTGAHAEELMAQGAMGETRRFDLADGTTAVYKRQTRDWDRGWDYPILKAADQADAEELTAVTAAALGVKAPAIVRTSDTEMYMELMPGKIGELAWTGRANAPKRVVASPQGIRMGLLDTLVENTDRHGGNYLADEDDNLYAIDHGLAFSKTDEIRDGQVQRRPVDRFMATGEFALANFVSPSGNLYDNPLTQADAEKLKQIVAGLRQQFVDQGRLGWWESMNERALHIAARATGTMDVL